MQFGSRHNQRSFAEVPQINGPRSVFDRSYEVHDTYQFDFLTPVHVDEVLPGDTVKLTMTAFARLTTQVKPVMDRLYASVEFFFCPDRLVWDNQKKFMGEQLNPGDSIDFINPQMTAPASTGFATGSLMDHMGLVPGVASYLVRNTKPLRSYLRVWNEWYRDENLQNSVNVPTGNGPDSATDFPLLKRNKMHDYFTSCLPWPQKGNAVSLPLGTTAPVFGTGKTLNLTNGTTTFGIQGNSGTGNVQTSAALAGANVGTAAGATASTNNVLGVVTSGSSGLYTDLSTATAATINALRQAFLTQEFLEMDARGGTRYVETIPNHFNGTILPDFTAQRPEFLGGGHFDLTVSPVAQTAPTSGSSYQGNLAAFATLNIRKESQLGFTKSFNEWGTVLGLITFRAAITYQQGNNRFWNRSTRYDYAWPVLSGLGEQLVLNGEIFVSSTQSQNDAGFGYQERFAEYKYKPSEIRGEFRSDYTQSLDVWHQAEDFASLPALNSTFIQSNTPISRLVTVSPATASPILMDSYFKIDHTRCLPVHNIPARLGRF